MEASKITDISNIKKLTLPVLEMTCASCAINVENQLKKQAGIKSASVNFANSEAVIEIDENQNSLEKIKKSIIDIGYDIIISRDDNLEEELKNIENKRYKLLKNKTILSFAFAIPVFVLSMFFMDSFKGQNFVLLLLSLTVIIYSGNEFYVNAFKLASKGLSNMDTLVALGTGIAFIYSLFNTLFPQLIVSYGLHAHVYYESAVIIISFILLGRFFEEKSKSNASKAIKNLIALQPKTLTILRNGFEMQLPLNAVMLNDKVIIKPGEKIPVDGIVINGNSFVDESMLTGEAIPVNKIEGSEVFAGTININSLLQIDARKIGKTTLLAGIIKLIKEAQSSKPKIQKLVDKISSIFVPVIIILSIITFITWWFFNPAFAIVNMISVLIIACPCALGLAAPVAIVVSVGKAASKGILIKNSDAFNYAHKLNTIVFDKTGTITLGKPEVKSIKVISVNENDTLSHLLTLESGSDHPLAKAIVSYLESKNIKKIILSDFQNHPGKGVSAIINLKKYYAGTHKFLSENNINIPEDTSYDSIAKLYFADEKGVLAIVNIEDKLNEKSLIAINKLKEKNLDVHMLTGDNLSNAAKIANQAGITKFKAEALPADKAEYIKQIRQSGNVVAMVGDGINDSAALAQADLGIAMSAGTDIAIESSSLTLLNNNLENIPEFIDLSAFTHKIIRQNLFWAFIYNIIAIPIAAGILYPFYGFLLNPMIAGIAMAFSSVSVVLNSSRIRH